MISSPSVPHQDSAVHAQFTRTTISVNASLLECSIAVSRHGLTVSAAVDEEEGMEQDMVWMEMMIMGYG